MEVEEMSKPRRQNIRDNFLASVRKALRERVNNRCSRPECGKLTISSSEASKSRVVITGRAAHITAAAAGGPRFNPLLSAAERSAAENGIWLCADCASLVDDDRGAEFSVLQLQSWKRQAEEAVVAAARLRVSAKRPEWLNGITSPHYVNVPRLLHMAGHDALGQSCLEALKHGFPKDRWIIRELIEVETFIRRLPIKAVDLNVLVDQEKCLVEGMLISYEKFCRTKNGSNENPDDVRTYNFNRSPLIYTQVGKLKYVQPYDPMWITTKTAEGTVRQGGCRLAGLAMIKKIDLKNGIVIASPLVFGAPSNSAIFDG